MPRVSLDSLSPSIFPTEESDSFEFKSSQTPLGKLSEKINAAASGFSNNGGGCLIVGVDKNGDPDGGFANHVGKQPLRDWIDQSIALVSPPVTYEIKLFNDCEGRGNLDQGKSVVTVSFLPSESIPHMASDKRYYIRAGAHTLSASHFIVESLWARRRMTRPYLSHAIRAKPNYQAVVQIGVISLGDTPAIDVEFGLDPLPQMLRSSAQDFPMRIPAIDRSSPFFIDVAFDFSFEKEVSNDTVVRIQYRDLAGNAYQHQSDRPLKESISPLRIGADPAEKIARAIEKLAR